MRRPSRPRRPSSSCSAGRRWALTLTLTLTPTPTPTPTLTPTLTPTPTLTLTPSLTPTLTRTRTQLGDASLKELLHKEAHAAWSLVVERDGITGRSATLPPPADEGLGAASEPPTPASAPTPADPSDRLDYCVKSEYVSWHPNPNPDPNPNPSPKPNQVRVLAP